MSKINQIQAAILSLDPGAYQKLMDSYIMRKYGFSNIMPLGSHSGTNKVTKGTPDSFVQCTDGRFILIAHYIESNYNDRVSMSFLFGVVCNLPEEQRLSAVMIFCKCNPDFDAFRNIHIMPTHASWSGSEVSIIEQYIAFLIKLRENLKGIQFIEHRAYISEGIQDLQKRKEEVLLREFLEER